MSHSKYDSEIEFIKDKIQRLRFSDPSETLQLCHQLLVHADIKQDDGLFGYAYYYLSEAYFSINDYKSFMEYLLKGISYQQRSSQGALLARTYNVLAVNAGNQGNDLSALDHYMTALRFCKEYNLSYETGMVYTNLGHIYTGIKQYDKAIEYFSMGLPLFATDESNPFYWSNVILAYTAIGDCYYKLDNMESALEFSEKALSAPEDNVLDYSKAAHLAFRAKLLITIGQEDEGYELIDHFILIILKMQTLVDIYEQIFSFCEFLLSIEKFNEMWTILTRIEALTLDTEIANIELILLRIKIAYYKRVNDEYSYLHATARYFEISQKMLTQKADTNKDAIDLRFRLEEVQKEQDAIKQENAVLQEHSEHDPLTGLPNRYKLNAFSEEAISRAKENKTMLGVEIFDLDYFKQYNDTYGHQAGDDCLYAISRLLKNMMTEGIFCARYGGDEFVVIYENKTDEEILALANKLKEDVIALGLEHKNSLAAPVVTISQGIRNSIPSHGNKMWDYLFTADSALYEIKRSTRNQIHLVHKTSTQSMITGVVRIENK